MNAMTYGSIEIIKLPDGSTDTLNFVEAQKKYGDFLERADPVVKERFAPCITHFKARNNIGRNGFELQKLLATIKTIRIYTDHMQYTEGAITFGEAQERFGMNLEFLATEQREKFAKELAKYHELTTSKYNTPVETVSDTSSNTATAYVITCTKVRMSNSDSNSPMEFISTEVYEGKYYTNLNDVLKAFEKMLEVDTRIENRYPNFFKVKRIDKLSYVYSEMRRDCDMHDSYIYAISPLSKDGLNLDTKHVFDDIKYTQFRVEGTTYKKEDLY